MANLKISQLPDSVELKDVDIMPIVQTKEDTGLMETRQISVGNLLAASGGGNNVSVAWKNQPGTTIVLEPTILQYNLSITQNAVITIDRKLIPTGKNIAFIVYFNVNSLVSIRFADNVRFQDGKVMSQMGEYYYSFFHDERNGEWFAKLDYSIIR